ncbi:aminotransferase class IV [Phycisphaera mikurensis]|uniref:branched-chain-amino-acid transaminase n=1 Tax=Phycisphaera mikurensis (strain NBRC 102666 / KCTC 22515 / FYK2301M01) TaxID=1142394 RepID=I0IFQ8_PHYMF|nr:aminotransferase class IV [Phycisphaera mikurensis]MBB6440514.1 branched-subunit amino acid aminotransferase/4-amino-4-deoxychorismate lyase [Phycisphaera mikurensis]BAM04096.1 putative branched-chain-amino-acid aminotransferase [Phycisphaera mikurensis NBRC 102666]
MQSYVNGSFHDADDPALRVEDAGFQHAVGLFETFQVHRGRPFRLDAHLARLAGSAATLGLAADMAVAPLVAAVEETIRHNGIDRARCRLTVTAGTVSLLRADPRGGGPAEAVAVKQTVAIVPQPPTIWEPSLFEDGVAVTIHGPAANPFDDTAGHKTLNYWQRLRSLRRAAAQGAAEAIWLNVSNHLASGCVSNLLLVKDGVLLSPFARGEEEPGALPAPVLPGVTRQLLLEAAADAGLAARKRMLTIDDLLDADEVMLTNSGWGVLPVVRVEKKPIGDGRVGPATQRLRKAWSDAVAAETAEPG